PSGPFVEALAGAEASGGIPANLGYPNNVGDAFNIDTTYDASLNAAEFYFHDLTTNHAVLLYYFSFTDINSGATFYPSDAYDGSTGELIDERPEVPVGAGFDWSVLRMFGTNTWTSAQLGLGGGALQPIGNSPNDGEDMV